MKILLGYSQEIILDLSIVTPFAGVQIGILESISIKNAKQKLRNANIREKQKITKYEESCKRNNFLFIPDVRSHTQWRWKVITENSNLWGKFTQYTIYNLL